MITVLGGTGFIGSHIIKRLKKDGLPYTAPSRNANLFDLPLGNVIYCIGLTADFRTRPFDTVESHVSLFSRLLRDGNFDSLVYLSSTRVYNPSLPLAIEHEPLQVNVSNPSDLYNVSKLMGESIALHAGREHVRVARISNVYGADFASETFLSSIIRDALTYRKVTLHTALDSVKDYISVESVITGLLDIVFHGRERIYNIASGRNISNKQLSEEISRLTGAVFEVEPNAPTNVFPPISITRMQQEFNFEPSDLIDDLDRLIQTFRERYP